MDAATMNLIATVVLVAITGWYAFSTAQMLREMERQATSSRRQSVLLAKAAQISALAALLNAAGHPAGEEPFSQIRQLLKELQQLDAAESREGT